MTSCLMDYYDLTSFKHALTVIVFFTHFSTPTGSLRGKEKLRECVIIKSQMNILKNEEKKRVSF